MKSFIRNLLVSFLGNHPKFVWQLRSLKHHKKFINFNKPVNLYEYIAKSAVYYDKRWCVLGDKFRVREEIKKMIGEKYLNELYGVYDNADKIVVEDLPQSFVLKTTNGCATNIIVKDKQQVDWKKTKAKLNKWLATPYGEMTGQPHYTQMKPRIIAEKFLEQKGKTSLTDYKFYCVNGKPVYVLVCENRGINSHLFEIGAFDMNWNPLPSYLSEGMPHAGEIKKPGSFEEMKSVVTKLAENFKFVRIDFYDMDECPIFGEYTFTPNIIDLLSEKCNADLFHSINNT